MIKVVFLISIVIYSSALFFKHNIDKRVLPIDQSCDPDSGRCRKGDWIATHIADCEHHGILTCNAIDDRLYSWTVNIAKGDKCKARGGTRLRCGAPGTSTRCVCSDEKIKFNKCKCQYWPPEDVGANSPAFCTGYYTGGSSNLHHWACCNNCNDTEPNTCDAHTYEGGSSSSYCSTCGRNTGGGRVNTILIVVTVMVSRHVRIDAGHLIIQAYAGNG